MDTPFKHMTISGHMTPEPEAGGPRRTDAAARWRSADGASRPRRNLLFAAAGRLALPARSPWHLVALGFGTAAAVCAWDLGPVFAWVSFVVLDRWRDDRGWATLLALRFWSAVCGAAYRVRLGIITAVTSSSTKSSRLDRALANA